MTRSGGGGDILFNTNHLLSLSAIIDNVIRVCIIPSACYQLRPPLTGKKCLHFYSMYLKVEAPNRKLRLLHSYSWQQAPNLERIALYSIKLFAISAGNNIYQYLVFYHFGSIPSFLSTFRVLWISCFLYLQIDVSLTLWLLYSASHTSDRSGAQS